LVETIKLVCGLDKNYPIIYKPLPEEDPKMRRPDMTLAT
jgi:hypothetical protein